MSLDIQLKNDITIPKTPKVIRDDIVRELRFINPKWIENERMGRWNRDTEKYLQFYDEMDDNTLKLPRGYMRQLILLCRQHNIEYHIDDQRRILPAIDFAFDGKLKPFQEEAVKSILSKEFGALSAPTGSGKTVIALYAVARRRQSALIVVHTKDLAFQWIERIQSFLSIPKDDIGLIGAGKHFIGEKITVALVQSLYKCAEDVSNHIGYLIVDECHKTPSRTFTQAVAAFDSKYMLGLSATPWRRDKLSKLIFFFLGDTHHSIEKSQLVEEGHLLDIDVVFRETNFKPYYDPTYEYSKMVSELTADDERNRLIASDVAREIQHSDGVALVLSDRKKHCENLYAILKYKFSATAELLTGDTPTNERLEIIEKIERGDIRVLIATGQLVGEGFDCKNLTSLFITTPVRFSGRLIQYLGRVLRPAPGKKKAKIFDYVDIHVGPLKAAANARRQIYQKKDPIS